MRIKRPDHKNAIDLVQESEKQMKFTFTLPVNDESTFTVVRNIYECFRMLGDALLISKGIESSDHYEQVGALFDLNVNTKRPVRAIDNLRRMRHNINYYGYHPNIAETLDAIDIAKSCFRQLAEAVRKEIQK